MEDLMPDLIERLDRWLQENRSGYYSQLLPGLTDEKVIEFEEALGVSLTYCAFHTENNPGYPVNYEAG